MDILLDGVHDISVPLNVFHIAQIFDSHRDSIASMVKTKTFLAEVIEEMKKPHMTASNRACLSRLMITQKPQPKPNGKTCRRKPVNAGPSTAT